MIRDRTSRSRLVLAVVIATTLAACASAPSRNDMLDDAKASYERTASEPDVVRSAQVELGKAQQALRQAEASLRAGADPSIVDHYAYVAKQRTLVALEAGKVAQAQRAVADASHQRDSILIEARTLDADSQRNLAEKARMDAAAERKLAEERLAAARRSEARARSLEQQLNDLKAKQTERGMVLTLGDVLFDFGRAELSAGATRTLDQLATFLRENPARTIEIEGYTDAIGSDEANQVLSERRAVAVKIALVDRGIGVNRITARGFGKSRPVASNDTAAGRQQNRRVEIVFSRTG